MTIEVHPGITFERLPDGAVKIGAFILNASEWTALVALLAWDGHEHQDEPADGVEAREYRWRKAQALHRVVCFDPRPEFKTTDR